MKHLFNPANQTSIKFDNVFTGALPDLVVVRLERDGNLSGGYKRNPFNYQNFGGYRIELNRNDTPMPTKGYTLNFANNQYKGLLDVFPRARVRYC